jgi:hypothetical protein
MTHAHTHHAHAHLNVNVMGSYGTTMRGLPFLGGDPALHHRVENAILEFYPYLIITSFPSVIESHISLTAATVF